MKVYWEIGKRIPPKGGIKRKENFLQAIY